MTEPVSELTHDAFLGGRLTLWQPAKGYRAATDPVLLAAACPARPGESALDLGCGVGTAALCLGSRVDGLRLFGVERQPEYAALARRNGSEAGIAFDVTEADLSSLPFEIRALSFDHVIANPPYYAKGGGTAAQDMGREGAQREQTPLAVWTATARARLKPRGWLTMIQAAERLPDVLSALSGFGSVSVLPLQPRVGRDAGRVLIRARKGGGAPFRLHAPILIHEGRVHERDGDSYTGPIRSVLRDGAPIDWPDRQ